MARERSANLDMRPARLRQRTGKALRESRAMLEAILDNTSDIVFCVDVHSYRILAYNRAFAEHFVNLGETRVHVGASLERLLPADEDRLRWRGFVHRAVTEGSFSYDCDAAGRRLQLNVHPLAHDEIVFGIAVLARDRTEHESLGESEAPSGPSAESTSEFLWEVDASGLFTYVSPSVERILGRRPDELVGAKHFYDLFVPERHEELKAGALGVFAARQSFRAFAYAGVDARGAVVYLESRGAPVLDADARLQGYRGATMDVTPDRGADEPLRRSTPGGEASPGVDAGRRPFERRIVVSDTPGVVGESAALQEVLAQVRQVAPTGSSVLITGETGTGKELIAQAIHRLSPRRDRPMISLNCATLPAGLAESELFGHEKGAYTGAFATNVGRFERADGSTLFLDEIGELSGELQAKLLRVLDEGQFERLGSSRRRTADVRLIVATNRDLPEEVSLGRFRADLYYRLNVFPIHLPPLRERTEDIPLLVWQFVDFFAGQAGKVIERISRETMQRLREYAWPGNVRELRNVIERAVVLSNGAELQILLPSPYEPGDDARELELRLESVERRHISRVLAQTGGRIAGPGGAASLLGVNRTTLQSMIKRLGIARDGSH